MHILFLNPQGNFDPQDSYLAQHPDFGGQLVYVKELACAMAQMGHKVDIITRRIDDPDWPEFADPQSTYPGFEKNVRILRFDCGGPKFLLKEALWPHMPEFIDNMLAFYGNTLPDFATAHYADGGYCAVLLKARAGINFSFTGHSLGAQKLDKMGMNAQNATKMETRYHFSTRIDAERAGMNHASRIFTSTDQERREQYSHPLYQGAVSIDEEKFAVVPPGVNTKIFTTRASDLDAELHEKLNRKFADVDKPFVLASSRLDEKKNILGVAQAFANSPELRARADLVLCIRGIDDPFAEISQLAQAEQKVLGPILETIEAAGLRDQVHNLNIQSQAELAATYRFFAKRKSVFTLTAFYEPFGLAPIEAAACGLACLATKNGGPSEIFEDGSGILADPFDAGDIARGLLIALENFDDLATRSRKRVNQKYTWAQTAEGYLTAFKAYARPGAAGQIKIPQLGKDNRLLDYLEKNSAS